MINAIDNIMRILVIMEAITRNFADNIVNFNPVISMNLDRHRFHDYVSIIYDLINSLSGDDKKAAMELTSSVIHAFNEEVYFASLVSGIPNGAWFYIDLANDEVFWSFNMDEVDNEIDWAKKPTQMKRMTKDLRREIILRGFDAI